MSALILAVVHLYVLVRTSYVLPITSSGIDWPTIH